MRPLDQRLLARSAPARRHIVVTAALGLITSIAIGFQALILARGLAPALAPEPLTEDGLGGLGALVPVEVRELSTAVAWLGVVVLVRVVLHWVQERLAHRAGQAVVDEFREALVDHVSGWGPRWSASGEGAAIATLATRGLDALMPYFVRYLPQLMLAVTVTPLMLIVVLGLDPLSALIVFLTLPLIPIFMVLIGLVTRDRSRRHLEAMQRLAERTLDLISGVPTLQGLGRARGPAARIRELGEAQRAATMGSLRVAFLSGMVLELLTTLSVAIVAVSLGFRLLEGGISIETALAVLILAPEIYLPLRAVGQHFHASADGLAAADATFTALATPAPQVGTPGGIEVSLRDAVLELKDLSVATPDGSRLAPAGLNLRAEPGRLTVLAGPNGEGKSTALLVLAGLLSPTEGDALAGGSSLANADATTWSHQCAWVPQRPDIGAAAGTLSLGQRQLAALERALTSGRPVMLLDEPTAHLDGEARVALIARIIGAARDGATVVVASHDEALIEVADAVFEVRAGVAA